MIFSEILSYLNRISFIFLLITAIFFVYQIYIFKREIKFKKDKNITIPTFREDIENKKINYTPFSQSKPEKDENFDFIEYLFKKRLFYLVIPILFFLLLLFFLRQLLINNQNSSFSNNKKIENEVTLTFMFTPTDTPTDYYNNFQNNQKDKEELSKNLTQALTLISSDLSSVQLTSPTLSLTSNYRILSSPKDTISHNFVDKKVEKLPISGIFDKNILIIFFGLFLIFVSILF